jgi:alpha-tubulin suppressor-like RCC1 family protein
MVHANYVQAFKDSTAGTEAILTNAAYSNWGSVKPQKGPSDVVLATLAMDNLSTADGESASDVTRVDIVDQYATAVDGGGEFTVALSADGVVYAWGYNNFGQLGQGITSTRITTPVPVTGGSLAGKTVTSVAAGLNHTLALDSDGGVHAWGINNNGRLGQGNTTQRNAPVVVTGGSLAGKTVTAISNGNGHTLAVDSDGGVHAWGNNGSGRLGVGDEDDRLTPVLVTGGSLAGKTVTTVAGGGFFTVAITSDGVLHAWGDNTNGQIGQGVFGGTYTTPVAVTLGSLAGKTITAAASGRIHVLALDSDGSVHAWGRNDVGQLGIGSNSDSNVPVEISGYSATAIRAGRFASYFLGTDGVVYAFGEGSNGQLAQGSLDTGNKFEPVPIVLGSLTGKTVITFEGGQRHAVALDSDGGVHGWGLNDQGQLGVGDQLTRFTPVAVDPPFGPPVPMTYAYSYNRAGTAGDTAHVSVYYLHDKQTRNVGGARVVFADSVTSKVLLLHTLKDVADVSFVTSKAIGSSDSLVAENPVMTGNSTSTVAGTVWKDYSASGFVASASSVSIGTPSREPFRAFDHSLDFWHSLDNTDLSNDPEWLRLDYPVAVVLKKYFLQARSQYPLSQQDFPNTFDIQGTNADDPADADWVTLDTQTGQASLITSDFRYARIRPGIEHAGLHQIPHPDQGRG